MIGRRYLDPGDRLAGRHQPPLRVTVLARWGPGRGPRNVLIQRENGTRDVVPFARRLRVDPCPWWVGDRVVWPHREGSGRRRRDVQSAGTVTAVDLPNLPAGVEVTFDEPVNGARRCYATYDELRVHSGLRPEAATGPTDRGHGRRQVSSARRPDINLGGEPA
jgi:hypothetical protein